VLNPYFAYYLDTDDYQGSWMEWGVSHDFAMSKLGMKDAPILKDITVTPSFVMGIDHRYYSLVVDDVQVVDKSTRLATLVYGLAVSYDISGALNLPKQAGSLKVTGMLNYSQAPNDTLREYFMDDVLYGGMGVNYQW